MTTEQMDPVFASALRDALVRHVGAAARRRRRWRWQVGLGVIAGSTLVAGGAALAASLLSQPGAPVDTEIGNIVAATRTGTATIELGRAPAGATDLSLTLTCLSVGTFYFPNGSNMSCAPADLRQPPLYRQASEVVPLAPGGHSVTIRSSPGESWALQAAYVNQVVTPWATNGHGQTFGVPNERGTPDLVAVVIDQGKTQGYVKESDLNCASGRDAVHSPAEALAWDKASQDRNISVPVYESDGTTVIGAFIAGHAMRSGAPTVPLSSLSLGCRPAASPAPPAPGSQTPSTASPAAVTTVQHKSGG